MLNKTKIQFEQFKKAKQRLQEALDQPFSSFIRDSAIQRFEMCFDLVWKLLKSFLEEHHGIICASPKKCIREAYKQNIIDYDEFWLEICEFRNQTAHLYLESVAQNVFDQLPTVQSYFQKLQEKIEKEIMENKF